MYIVNKNVWIFIYNITAPLFQYLYYYCFQITAQLNLYKEMFNSQL